MRRLELFCDIKKRMMRSNMIQFSILFFVLSTIIHPLWGAPAQIGVVLDVKSSVGKTVLSCINMAVSDITAQNGTEIKLHVRDTKGSSMGAINAVQDLLNNVKVQAIIVPELTMEASIVASLGDKAEIPILSFTSVPSASAHPYYLQIKEDETVQFDAIIALVEKFNWRNIIFIYEETDNGRNSLKDIVDKFQGKIDRVVYKSLDPIIVDDGMIIDELVKLKDVQTSVFVLHTNPNLGAKVFLNAKRLGMMNKGYAWLVTTKMMDFMDPSGIDAMQGALGLKSYIPASKELQNFVSRWKSEVQSADPGLKLTELNIYGVKVYDTIRALSKATANLVDPRLSSDGSEFLQGLLQSEYRGFSGDYLFINGTLNLEGYEVVNVGNREGIVGYWRPATLPNDGIDLKPVIWPGRSTNIPKSLLFHESGRRLQIAYPVKGGFAELISQETDKQNNVTKVNGFIAEVFYAAIDCLGYDVPYDLVPYKNVTGGFQTNYDEIVDSVYLKRYDGVIGDISITANRSLYVDFTIPYTEIGLGTIVKKDKESRWFFLRPLDTDLWIGGGFFFLMLGVIVWLIEHPINEDFQGSTLQQIGTILWFSVCTLVYAQRERLKSNLSKFVVGIWLFVVFILTASYTAILSSTLTVQQIQATAGDNIGYQYGSSVRGNVINNFNFSATDSRLLPLLSQEEYASALSKRKEEGGVGAIIDEMPYIRIFLAQYPSDYALLETSYTTNGFGFFFQKGSPLVLEFSRAIEYLRETRKLQELELKWYSGGKRDSLLPQQNDQTGRKTLSLSSFQGLFLISVLSKLIALAVLLFFFLRKRISRKLSEVLLKIQMAVVKKYFSSRVGNASNAASPPRATGI